MTQERKHTLIWFSAGLFCSLLVLTLVVTGLSGKVLVTDPDGIPEAVDVLMTAVCTGDRNALQEAVSGRTALNPVMGDEHTAERLLWEAYQNSLRWQCHEDFEILGGHVTQTVTVTCLDIPGAAKAIAGILEDTGTEGTEALHAAAQQVLQADAPMTQQELTLTFLREKGRWRVLPDAALLSLLSGFILH